MRRTTLLLLIALLAAAAAPTAGSAASFAFPAVSRDVDAKPTIGPARGPAPKRLRTKDVVVGTGRTARAGDQVTTQYVGVL